ncbi:MAG: glycosyltransferase family 39 protein [Devosia sp.]
MGSASAAQPGYVRYSTLAVVVLLFALACIVGRLTTYFIFILILVAIITPSLRTAFVLRSRNPMDVMLLVAAVLPGLAFAATAKTPQDLLYAINFLPLAVAVPFRWQLERNGRADGATIVAWLSLAGAAIAFVVAVVQVLVLRESRAGPPLMSAFQFADTAVLLGFFALVGLMVPGSRWRLLLLAGPILGCAAAVFGGTRGAVVAAPVLAVIAIGFAFVVVKNRRALLLAVVGLIAVAAIALFVAGQLGLHRALSAFGDAAQVLTGGNVSPETRERLVMYGGGLQAFFNAPLFGYGWANMVPAIEPYIDPAYVERVRDFRHLHNGLLSFAVGAGIPGIISFVVLSVAPVVAVFSTPRDAQFVARLYLALTLCAGYAVFQLTIIMIGFEFHTVQFAFMAVTILAFVKAPVAAAAGDRAAVTPAPPPTEGERYARLALLVIGVATLVRLGIVALLPAGVDEAYTIGIAREFSLSYFDHPPLHQWITGGMERLGDSLLLLRLPFIAIGALSGWLMFLLARTLFGAAAGFWAVLLFSFAPVFGLAHTMLILPDGPLIAASLGAVLVVARIMLRREPGDAVIGQWLLAGACASIAILSKYHGVLLVGGLFLFLVTSRDGRRWLGTPGPWMAAAVAALGMVPALIWNAQNDWVSFAFQGGRGMDSEGLRALGPLASLGTQFLYLLPWIAVGLTWLLVRAGLGGPTNPRRWLMFCLAIVPIGLFTGLTLFAPGLAHWPMPGWLFAIPLLAEAIANAGRLGRLWVRVATVATVVLLVGFVVVGTMQARWGTFDGPILAVLGSDPTETLSPWDALPKLLADQGLAIDDRTVVVAQSWARAGLVTESMGRQVPVMCLCSDQRHFQFTSPYERFVGWNAIIVGDERFMDDARLSRYFNDLGTVDKIVLERGGRDVLPLWVRTGADFRPDGS